MIKERPPFILGIMADSQGCGFHRMMIPLAALVESGAVNGRLDMAIWPDDALVATAPDVIVWQRQVEDGQVEAMARLRKLLPNTLFVYELDDNLAEVPEASYHSSFMPPDIEARLSKAIALCDRVSTTTRALVPWFKKLGATDVRIAPNSIPVSRMKNRPVRTSGKMRIGFAGGISHGGDLEIIRHAMETIGEEVTWVFFGTQPENPACATEFHEGVHVTQYLDRMAQLDIDLMLAPLEDNAFNRSKSNLRLIEATSVGAAVIAQDLAPYHIDHPPVWAHPRTPEQWTAAIKHFIHSSPATRQKHIDEMKAWVGSRYILERCLQHWQHAWLPDEGKGWKPRADLTQSGEFIVSASDCETMLGRLPYLKSQRLFKTLEDACREAITEGHAVLWLRQDTYIDKQSLDTMLDAARNPKASAVVPLAGDGANAFPQKDKWTPMTAGPAEILASICRIVFTGRGPMIIPAASGPIVVLTPQTLRMIGLPDVAGCGSEEQAIFEWSLQASARGWSVMQTPQAYGGSTAIPAQPTQAVQLRVNGRALVEVFKRIPAEELSADDRIRIESMLLKNSWGGPRPGMMGFDNSYATWTKLRAAQGVKSSAPCDCGFEVVLWSMDDSSMPEYVMSADDWVVFVDDTIVLYDVAVFVETIKATVIANAGNEDLSIIYTDHDTLVGQNKNPELKPDFDFNLFLAQDYVTPICAIKRSKIREAQVWSDGDKEGLPTSRVDLYKIVLQIAVMHIPLKSVQSAIVHLPIIAGHMETNLLPEVMAVDALSRQLVIKNLATLGGCLDVTAKRELAGCLAVQFDWRKLGVHSSNGMVPAADLPPLVTIVIPTLGSGRLIQPCVGTILQHNTYPNYEILVVQNGPRMEPELSEKTAADPRVKWVYYDGPFNWSAINNWAINEHANGDYIVTLNDDVNVGTKWWLERMMGHALLNDVGAVGAKLIHPMGVLQHVGVVCHNGIAGHMHKMIPNGQSGHMGRAMLTHEATAVTGACMLFSRENFNKVGGFNESYSHNYNDTVFCMELRKHGLRNVVEITAELLHPEGTSRDSIDSASGMSKIIAETIKLRSEYPDPDPYWNTNLALQTQNVVMVHGLNADNLAWQDFRPQPGASRILVINDALGDKGMALGILECGNVPFCADLSGFTLRLIAPMAMNIPAWDIRKPAEISRAMKLLGINLVVIRSLVGAMGAAPPVEALRALHPDVLKLPVAIDPVDVMTVAPWLSSDGRKNDDDRFGMVDMAQWREAYDRIMGNLVAA